jgi:peptidoglycan L-alanyl-D-glutamate endopeptidase CwlK
MGILSLYHFMDCNKRKQLNLNRASKLIPELEEILIDGLHVLDSMGWFPYVVSGYRSNAEQSALYAQGRESLDEVNKLRLIANMPPLTENENLKIVTKVKAGGSKHNTGEAFDIVNYPDGGVVEWDNIEFYKAANMVFSEHNLKWGGSWRKFVDRPHFEL